MNPIAILAFIAGIGTSAPQSPAKETKPRESVQQVNPCKESSSPLVRKRGGWDRN